MPNENGAQAQPAINYQLLRLYIDSIPSFDGNTHTLGIYVDNCESLIKNFARQNDDAFNNFILRAILGKLTGRALMIIGSRTELKTWQEIKAALYLCFGDQRDIDCLIQDLIALRPNRNETPYNFGMRIQDTRSLVINKLNTLTMTPNEKLIRLTSYDDLALKTFIKGLPLNLQTIIRLRNPDSLEKAMSFVIEEENFLYSTNKANSLNTQSNFRPTQRQIPIRQTNPPNFNQYSPNLAISQIPRPNFQPLPNFQPRPFMQNNHFPFRPPNQFFNSQFRPNFNGQNAVQQPNVFQKHPYFLNRQNNMFQNQNQNINRPNQSNQNNKPEPMDTSSSNSRIKPKPKYIATELYNQNINENVEIENPPENKSTENQYCVTNTDNQYYSANTENQSYYSHDPYSQNMQDSYYYDNVVPCEQPIFPYSYVTADPFTGFAENYTTPLSADDDSVNFQSPTRTNNMI